MTEQDILDLIFEEVGGNIPDVAITLEVSTFWNLHIQYLNQFHLRKAHTKLSSIVYLLGQLRFLSPASIGDHAPMISARIDNLARLQNIVQEEVMYWKKYYHDNRPGVITKSCVKAMIEPCGFQPNPNSRRLRGDAIIPPMFYE